jgi:hypothetical protein
MPAIATFEAMDAPRAGGYDRFTMAEKRLLAKTPDRKRCFTYLWQRQLA